jgi:hypothetical protein
MFNVYWLMINELWFISVFGVAKIQKLMINV